jgi:AraC-like DNA-binding protein
MLAKTSQEFQAIVLNKLSFSPFSKDNYTLYKNPSRPEYGYFLHFSREGYYDFGIADYTIPRDFSVTFHNPELLMRFGTVYTGITHFKIEDNPVSSFTPSSFFVLEKDIKGKQVWKAGQHFHGAEITIHERYFEEVIKPSFPTAINFESFINNYTYRYLPLEIASIIQQLQSLSQKSALTEIYLESKILECIAILANEIYASPENAFTNQLNYGNVKIGKNRSSALTASDIHAIQKAYDILTENAVNPPTIENLSKIIFLNQQKLKAGFSAYYHMSIGEYTNSIRMTTAANLLATTDLSIEEIAKKVGYNYCGNFAKMFRKLHGKTPLAFRKAK